MFLEGKGGQGLAALGGQRLVQVVVDPREQAAAAWAAFAAVWTSLYRLLRSHADRADHAGGFVLPGTAAACLAG